MCRTMIFVPSFLTVEERHTDAGLLSPSQRYKKLVNLLVLPSTSTKCPQIGVAMTGTYISIILLEQNLDQYSP